MNSSAISKPCESLIPVALGVLQLNGQHDAYGALHLSAVSGLVRSGGKLFVVADDSLLVGVFDDTVAKGLAPGPGQVLRLLDGDLPTDKAARKKAKPDFEMLTLLPALPGYSRGALCALGSGSGPLRQRGVLLNLGDGGIPDGRATLVDLTDLYTPLRQRFADLNLEGAWVAEGTLHILQRGNKSDARSACIRYDWNLIALWLVGQRPLPPPPKSTQVIALGDVDGVPLCFTDGAALANGAWAFSAVAEDTHNSVADGQCVASALGVVAPDGTVQKMWRLHGAPKVEGIAPQRHGNDWLATLVTDPDDPAVASEWLSVCW